MSDPSLEQAGFWGLWVAIHSLLGSLALLLGHTEHNALVTEQMATTVQTYTTRPAPRKLLKLNMSQSFNGCPERVEPFINDLTLYLEGQESTNDKVHIILALSLIKGGTGVFAGN